MKKVLLLIIMTCSLIQVYAQENPIKPYKDKQESIREQFIRPKAEAQIKKKMMKLPMTNIEQEIHYALIDRQAIFQGDIVLGENQEIAPSPEPHPKLPDFYKKYGGKRVLNSMPLTTGLVAVKQIREECLWFRGIITYEISNSFTENEKNNIENAINILETKTNLSFLKKENYPWYKDYIHFVKDENQNGGGRSWIGRQGGRQKIWLGYNAAQRTIIHEILHAAGIYHEQSRTDRDQHIEILWDNIELLSIFNFWKCDGFKIGNYDKESVMHYHGHAFGKADKHGKSKPTIIDRQTRLPLDYNSYLSEQDIDGINFLYPIDIKEKIPKPLNVLRTIELTIDELNTPSGKDGCGEVEYFAEIEMGKGWNWTPDVRSNTTNNKKTSSIEGKKIKPNWKFKVPLNNGEKFFKVHIKIREDDDLLCFKDDPCDINPIPDLWDVSLLVDTQTGEIFLEGTTSGKADPLTAESPMYINEYNGFEGFDTNDEDLIQAFIKFRVDIY